MSATMIYLALGSNLGDRLAILRAVVAALPPEVTVQAESPVYETPPWGYLDQPAFLNMVLQGVTSLEPLPFLAHLKQLEGMLGREKTFHWGPRRIDIDILFYDDLVLETPRLSLPHPGLAERAFVLVPLADLAADLRHPMLHKSVRELLAGVDVSGVKPYG
jgi:2-amino-4-hydroxy-6-hydroxymethyldihydropteridine diphosphokinase